MTPEVRVAQRWLEGYQTKEGLEIDFTTDSGKPDGRGWVVQTSFAKITGKQVGFLKFSYIPKEEFKRIYPTLVHFAVLKEGHHIELEDALRTPEELQRAMLVILGFSMDDPITPRKLLNLFKRRFGDRYEAFKDYHVDKPQVEYSHTEEEYRRRGVGVAMYEFTARLLAKRGLGLWSSTTQSTQAKAIWAAMIARGYPIRAVTTWWPRMVLHY